jgi:AraC-like DNA-binding protein
VRDPVTANPKLAGAIEAAFRNPAEPLAVDDLVLRLTKGLLDADPSCRKAKGPRRPNRAGLARARQFLDAETGRVVRAEELEAVSGLTRYDLARQFRAVYGTSPYRYSLLRRLDHAQARIGNGEPLSAAALAAGFADQAHFSRAFKAAHGLTPARFRGLQAARNN